eukprot:Plantae.Rhodophyta-Purpureofilum_apyrenoidigerum.ctg36187.p1 GENE.Plantae.Rhodophyta-Purpureofilum_apyrenoidigerum.ctg36187~~Plantae.Rhodophyta-Purpureofilum_apyrenoidigerum.ctg36187.p1  ORF type:complete len:263 (+),score=18.90 Plantae.Rhodophyta-Purpureofilum_apyrenoidigerum.ctg36187:136-924(+)
MENVDRCGVCFERKHSQRRPLCSEHARFCEDCEASYVRTALGDRFMFPLKCMEAACEVAVTLTAVQSLGFLSEEELRKFERFSKSVQRKELLYCPNPACAAAVTIGGVKEQTTTCDECQTSFCTTCRGKSHFGPCDVAPEQHIGYRSSLGYASWRTCSCGATLELTAGCNAVICICGRKQCFTCGAAIPRLHHACPQGCQLVNFEGDGTDDEKTSGLHFRLHERIGELHIGESFLSRVFSMFASFAASADMGDCDFGGSDRF